MNTINHHRYIFRLTRQEKDEPIVSFVQRLNFQLPNCNFADADDQVKDQIIEKCYNNELRVQACKHNMSLGQLIATAKTLEQAERNGIQSQSRQDLPNLVPGLNPKKPSFPNEICTRCGSNSHKFFQKICPALQSTCKVCNKLGHFSQFCRRLNSKRTHSDSQDFKLKISKQTKLMSEAEPARQAMNVQQNASNQVASKVWSTIDRSEVKENSVGTSKLAISSVTSASVLVDAENIPSASYAPKCNEIINEPSAKERQVEAPKNNHHSGLVGGMPVKIIVNQSGSASIMSFATFKKMKARPDIYKCLMTELLKFSVDDQEYLGQITVKLEVNEKKTLASFFVQKGATSYVTITEKVAQKLELQY